MPPSLAHQRTVKNSTLPAQHHAQCILRLLVGEALLVAHQIGNSQSAAPMLHRIGGTDAFLGRPDPANDHVSQPRAHWPIVSGRPIKTRQTLTSHPHAQPLAGHQLAGARRKLKAKTAKKRSDDRYHSRISEVNITFSPWWPLHSFSRPSKQEKLRISGHSWTNMVRKYSDPSARGARFILNTFNLRKKKSLRYLIHRWCGNKI